MPGMNGLELAARIRQGGAGVNPALPIISITASQSEGVRARLAELGVTVQAEKPISAGRILELVEKACESSGAPKDGSESALVFDLSAALEKVDGSPLLLRKLVALLLEELPQREEELAMAVEQKNFPRAHYLAHALKNSAGMLQLQQLQFFCAALEKIAESGEDCQKAWQNLREALPTAKKALAAYLDCREDLS
jgi:HPt (histidine-containing phosphotransfer) domain-containing protein